MEIIDKLSKEQQTSFHAVKNHAVRLLDTSPRFKFFTLHGEKHINSMLRIANILYLNGIDLEDDEIFLLVMSICVHDLGMVVTLKDNSFEDIFKNNPRIIDPTKIESYIRDDHHEMLDNYMENHLDFLTANGISPSDCGLIKEISKCHRKLDLRQKFGFVKNLGALLRIIDELDIGPERAPADVFLNLYDEMDSTSCWHWFKHNIVETWRFDHNVIKRSVQKKSVLEFQLVVRPPTEKTISYWLNQIRKPLFKVFVEESASRIVEEKWGVDIRISKAEDRSVPNKMGSKWEELEQKSFSGNKKVIILIDDEMRKLYDLLFPLEEDYTVLFAPNAKAGLEKIAMTHVDLAIVDMQIGSGDIWTREETDDFKSTGILLAKRINEISEKTQVGILTGTRHNCTIDSSVSLAFFEKKPIDPERFEGIINDILRD